MQKYIHVIWVSFHKGNLLESQSKSDRSKTFLLSTFVTLIHKVTKALPIMGGILSELMTVWTVIRPKSGIIT